MKRDIRGMKNAKNEQPAEEATVERLQRDYAKYAGKSQDELMAELRATTAGIDADRRNQMLNRIMPMLDADQKAKLDEILKNI